MGCVYLIKNKINDKRYIGKTILSAETRFRQHLNHAKMGHTHSLLYNAIRKYGRDNFNLSILCFVDNESELGKKEIELIQLHNTMTHNGYNSTGGGEGTSGKKISDNQKDKLRIHNQGRTRAKSGYTGVYQIKGGKKNKWRATISYNQKTVHLGCFKTIEEAAMAYNKKASELYGSSAKLNILHKCYNQVHL